MTAAQAFCLLAMASFVWSCIRYRKCDKSDGDRWLWLAYCMMILGFIALLRGWGL